MIVTKLSDLPEKYACKLCGEVKPIGEMCLVHTKRDGKFVLRPRCKACHNLKERQHRRDYKRNYLRRWRARNPKLTESYWKDVPDRKEKARAQMARHFKNNHDAILIQGRLRRRLGMRVDLGEARELLRQYGPCYPSRFGLTPEGLRECERIRSALRKRPKGKRFSNLEIRMMVYEDGLFIEPSRQKRPYQSAAEKLRKWQREQKTAKSLPAFNSCCTLRATSVAATADKTEVIYDS